MKAYTINKRGLWELLCQLRQTVNAEIAEKLNFEIQHGGMKNSTVLQAYASEVEESFQRGIDSDQCTDCEIGMFETRSGNPEFISLDDDCFDCVECE